MRIDFANNYQQLSDREMVELIITLPYNEEAALFLLCNRYHPLLRNVYRQIFGENFYWYEECRNDLFLHLRGKNQDWSKIRDFGWRSGFSTWLRKVAFHRFLSNKPYLTGKLKGVLSLDDGHTIDPPDEPGKDDDARETEVILMEAIGMMDDYYERFVILKELEGYSSREIADMMAQSWEKRGIDRQRNGMRVIPTADYVNVMASRARKNLRIIFNKIDR